MDGFGIGSSAVKSPKDPRLDGRMVTDTRISEFQFEV